ncbi:hypothetical protein H072_1077 [Dactylellina haptotyla CBS 200.50]|uniref:Sodium bile acid symporter family protein n=1 Tax=Dactylellina haptotyla (strain CBS 200.50) TaxID=1284197 RepID=S8AVD5_DACHA|nr:hypothetical protein H072_1077 [Dactylellina haptotyla CBS 200.50]
MEIFSDPPLGQSTESKKLKHATNSERLTRTSENQEHDSARNTNYKRSKSWSLLKPVIVWILDKWLVIGIVIACIAGYFAPDVAKPHGYIHSEWSIIYGAVAIIFLVSGLSIQTEKLLVHFSNWRLHFMVQGFSFLFIPTVFFCIVLLIAKFGDKAVFDRQILAGMIVTGCIPTTLSSNIIMTRLSGGDEAAALVSVTVGNLLGPFITPILITNVFWPTMDRSFDNVRPASDIHQLKSLYADVFKQIGLTVLLPLTLGQLIQGYFGFENTFHWVKKLFLNRISTFCLTLLVWTAFSSCFATGSLQKMPKEFLILIIFVNIGLYIFFTSLCVALSKMRIPYPAFIWEGKRFYVNRLKPLERGVFIAICFCAPAKTTGLGLPMVTAMWTRYPEEVKAKIQIAVVLYTIEQIFIAQGLVWWFSRKKKDEQPEDQHDPA